MELTSSFEGPEWDALRTLFGAYLHQGWKEMYGDAWGAVCEFRSLESPDYVTRAAEQVRSLLDSAYDENQLDEITGLFGSYYYPREPA